MFTVLEDTFSPLLLHEGWGSQSSQAKTNNTQVICTTLKNICVFIFKILKDTYKENVIS